MEMDKLKIEVIKQQDVAKLHNEINQIKNQQVLLTTSALTVFGIISGWLNNESTSHSYNLVTFDIVLLYILLFLFYKYSKVLKETAVIIAVYLIVTNSSIWEKNYAKFHYSYQKISSSFATIQSSIFIFLGISMLFYPFILLSDLSQHLIYLSIQLCTGTVYLVLIIRSYILTERKFSSNNIIKMWEDVLAKD